MSQDKYEKIVYENQICIVHKDSNIEHNAYFSSKGEFLYSSCNLKIRQYNSDGLIVIRTVGCYDISHMYDLELYDNNHKECTGNINQADSSIL